MSGTNRLGIKGAIASLMAAGALCTVGLGQGIPACDDPDPNAGDCFTVTPGIPGCIDLECCKIVCNLDPICCIVQWDEQCVGVALANCPGAVCDTCGKPACPDCFVDSPGTDNRFCNNECDGVQCPGCCETVCAVDSYCCDTDWDDICVGEAMLLCPCAPEDAPANDDCANAIDIVEGVFPYNNLCGTQDGPSLPDTPCNAKAGGVDGVGIDVWFNYTASFDGPVRVHTCDVADYETQVAVFEGCDCPADAATLIECNEDGVGCSPGTGSEIVFQAVAGACYKISVGGTYANTGTGMLIIEPVGAPANDDCASAEPISLNETRQFFNFAATMDGNPSPVCDFGGNNDIERDVWYSFTSPVSATLQVNLCASSFDTKAAVYEGGECPPIADPIACDDDGCGLQSLVEFEAVKGQTYLIRAGSRPGTGGGSGKIVVTQFAVCDVGGVVLLDQIGPDFSATSGQGLFASQDFDPLNDDADIAALDDFIVPVGPDLTLTCVDTVAGGFNGFDTTANITNYALQIYSSPAAAGMSLTGDVASLGSVPVVLVDPFDADADTFLFHMDLAAFPGPAITLPPGTYWIAVMPSLDFGAGGGQSAISGSTIDGSGNGPNGHQANPNGGFGFPNGFQQILVSAPCPWDIDGSGDVGVSDFLDLLGNWGACPDDLGVNLAYRVLAG